MTIEFHEARRLVGPNVYFHSPAIKLTLTGVTTLDEVRLLTDRLTGRIAWLAERVGWSAPPIKPEVALGRLVLAFPAPWTYSGQVLAQEAAYGVLDEAYGQTVDWEGSVRAILDELSRELPPPHTLGLLNEARARGIPAWWPYDEESGVIQFGYGARSVKLHISQIEAGVPLPWDQIGRVPIVAITGTNGKTTSTRLLARIGRTAGQQTGNTSSDGVVIGDIWVLGGDYTGASGAGRVLSDPYVQVAVLETARGGILRTGIGYDYPDVALLTNVTPDHLGQFGVDTVEQMAEVKGLLLELLPAYGRGVVNARDPLLVAQTHRSRAPIVYFSLEEQHPVIQAHRANGGEVVFARGEHLYFARGSHEQHVIAVSDIPIAYNGAAVHNIDNALGVIGAAYAMGWPFESIYWGLHDFWPTLEENPGRLNSLEVRGIRVVLDFAHNPDGVRALMQFGRNLRPKRLFVVIGAHGDRTNEMMRAEAYEVARSAQAVVIKEDSRALRGRQPGEVPTILQNALVEFGLAPNDILVRTDERAAVEAALNVAEAGDAILVMCHEERHGIMQWLKDLAG